MCDVLGTSSSHRLVPGPSVGGRREEGWHRGRGTTPPPRPPGCTVTSWCCHPGNSCGARVSGTGTTWRIFYFTIVSSPEFYIAQNWGAALFYVIPIISCLST